MSEGNNEYVNESLMAFSTSIELTSIEFIGLKINKVKYSRQKGLTS